MTFTSTVRRFLTYPLLMGLILGMTSPAAAIQYLFVEEEVPVFDKPKKMAPVVHWLQPGDKIPISNRKYGSDKGYFRIVWGEGKKRKKGYVRRADLKESYKESAKAQKATGAQRPYLDNWAIGLSLQPTFFQQIARTVDSKDGDSYEISAMTGAGLSYALYVDIPYSSVMMLRASLVNINTELSGEAKNQENPVDPNSEVKLHQNLIGLGLTLKYYGHIQSKLWYGLGGYIAKLQSVKLIFDGENIHPGKDTADLFFLGTVGAGWDFHIKQGFYLTPEVHLGAFSSKPVMLIGQGSVSLGWSF